MVLGWFAVLHTIYRIWQTIFSCISKIIGNTTLQTPIYLWSYFDWSIFFWRFLQQFQNNLLCRFSIFVLSTVTPVVDYLPLLPVSKEYGNKFPCHSHLPPGIHYGGPISKDSRGIFGQKTIFITYHFPPIGENPQFVSPSPERYWGKSVPPRNAQLGVL